MIQTCRPDTYNWQSEDIPPEVFTKHLLTALKIGYINETYPFRMLNLRTGSNDFEWWIHGKSNDGVSNDSEWWWIDGVYDDNIVLGYFTITVAHAGSPWKGYVSVFQNYIRAVNSKKRFFSNINPSDIILNAISKAKTNYFKNCTEDNVEIEEWRQKAKELRIERASIK